MDASEALEWIRNAKQIFFSLHALDRMKGRDVRRKDVKHALQTAKIAIKGDEEKWVVLGEDLDGEKLNVVVNIDILITKTSRNMIVTVYGKGDIMKTCLLCRKGTLSENEIPLNMEVDGQEYTASVRALTCNSCNESVISDGVLEAFELAVAERVSRSQSSGKRFKFMRKVLGFSSSELSSLLHVALETISRWENGKRSVDPKAFALLGLLVHENAQGKTDVLDHLKRLNTETHPNGDLGRLRAR